MPSTLLERDDELVELVELIDDACEGRGRVVLIEGPPGIGKTRLLEAARCRARARDMLVLAARASELDREFPFGVVRQLLEPPLAQSDRRRRTRLLGGAAAMAAPLLGVERAASAGPDGVQDRALERFHALYWLTANLSEEAPLMLAIDDLHWADATSLRFLEFLAPRLDELPVLLAVASRRAETAAGARPIDKLATDPAALVIRPAPLSSEAIGALVAVELGEEPESEFAAACRNATGGNPFLLRELVHELASEHVRPSSESIALVRQLAPPTVARAVLVRLARLGGDASALARAVAVLGDGVPLRRAAALAGMSDVGAEEAATALSHAHILGRDRPLGFAHPILRAAVYSDIDPGERAGAHRRAADLLAGEGAGADAVAVHLLASEPAGDHAVVETLREAAARALERGASAVAVACLRRALAEPPPADDRAAVTLELGSAELHAGEPAAATEHFDDGVRLAADPRTAATTAWQHALSLQALGRYDEAFALRERAADEVAEVDPQLALLVESSLIASAFLDRSRIGWARARLKRHRHRAAAGNPAAQRLRAIAAGVDAMWGDQPASELADIAESALASGQLANGRRAATSTAFFYAIEVLLMADRAEPAREALDEALEGARRRGSALAFACTSGWRCHLLARHGALAEAEADARSCAELALPQGWFQLAPPMLGFVVSVLIDCGELDDAEQLLERTGMSERRAGRDLALYPMLHARARLRAARGDVGGGRDDLDEIAQRGGRWNTDMTLVPALLAAPELAGDDRTGARAHAEQMLRDGQGWGTPRAIGMALRAVGLATGGERGVELLAEAVGVLERSPARVELARALTDLGAAVRRCGRRADARDPLRRALDLADACGAPPIAEHARHELRAAGGRPRRPRSSGADALTASEQRIAAMAADGLSNPQIAQALFVTKKTVEAHLGNAYRKLGISSRAQLPAALR